MSAAFKWIAVAILSASIGFGQAGAAKGPASSSAARGEAVFTQSCGSGYCHNGRGVGGGAPRLASRGFTQEYIATTVRNGVQGTSMPAFGPSLPAADLNAVIAYVAGLNGVTAGAAAARAAAPAKLTAAQTRGRDLFKEAVKGFGRCSTCHEVSGFGIPVAAPMAKVPASVAALKSLATPSVATVTAENNTMPALIVAKKANEVKFYDLTVPPPVLRTVAPADFASREGSMWSHGSVIGAYSDAELGAVLAYLRTVVR